MAPQSFSPRPSWLPGAAILAGCTAAAVAAGWALGARQWWMYMGLGLSALLGVGQLERLWLSRKAPRAPRSRGKLKVIPGGKSAIDLEKDDPAHRQRWLM
jgi:hypothetical protein